MERGGKSISIKGLVNPSLVKNIKQKMKKLLGRIVDHLGLIEFS